MDTEAALLAALHHDPADAVAWLALADWLEEHDCAEHARWLRRHRELRAMPESDAKVERSLEVQQAVTDGLRPVWPRFTNSLGMEMALIPAGTFLMGSPADEEYRSPDEELHEVEITRPFYLGVVTVTQAQYRAVTRKSPSSFRPHGPCEDEVRGLDTRAFPVENVSWNEAVGFCAKLSARKAEAEARRAYRLPSEAEWEYACRAWGASSLPYHFGRRLTDRLARYDWSDEDYPGEDTAAVRPGPVGQYPPNAFGLFDMHGNVDEWCHDLYERDYYANSPRRDPRGPDASITRVQRGGRFFDDATLCRCATRYHDGPGQRCDSRGFRVVCDWPEALIR